MVRKITNLLLICILLCSAFCTTANAKQYSVYEEGTLSTTYTQYFKDILSGVGFNENYIAFRSGQYSYTMLVGELEYSNGVIKLIGEGKEYEYSSTGTGYNNQYKYYVRDVTDSSINVGNNIIYSDVGDFPQLVERGAKYEILSTVLLCIFGLCIVINRIFFKR